MNKIFNRKAWIDNSQICHSNVISYGPSTPPLLQQGWSHLIVPWTQVHKYLSNYHPQLCKLHPLAQFNYHVLLNFSLIPSNSALI